MDKLDGIQTTVHHVIGNEIAFAGYGGLLKLVVRFATNLRKDPSFDLVCLFLEVVDRRIEGERGRQ